MKFSGKSAFQGIAIGEVLEFKKVNNVVKKYDVSNVEAEIARFHASKDVAMEELKLLHAKAVSEVGEANAAIFEAHQMMLLDVDFLGAVESIIRQQSVNAEYAVTQASENFAQLFSSMEDEYMRERAADVRDVGERVVRGLSKGEGENVSDVYGDSEGEYSREALDIGETSENLSGDYEKVDLKNFDTDFTRPVIIIADDLAPSETVQLDKSKVLAFVTRKGSTNSHTAILARTMNIPAVVCADVGKVEDGCMGIVDGFTGEIFLNPETEVLAEYEEKQRMALEEKKQLLELKDMATVTKSGKSVKLYANIGSVSDVSEVLKNGAEGIGLFRSEFLYLQSSDFPSEESQFMSYKSVAEMMEGKRVIIRTLDIGADKQIGYFGMDEEANPAMGYRAVRICLDRPDIFKTQLRALLRASVYGNIAIMIPMIVSVWEVQRVKEIVDEVKGELSKEGIPFGNPELGIMIETPAAALIADELAKEVDFFSIGTNDMTQYTLAIDRQNQKISAHYDAHHPAILKLIQMTVESAHAAGIWVGICGELAADTGLTEEFLKMGVDELSVSPGLVLGVRKKVRESE